MATEASVRAGRGEGEGRLVAADVVRKEDVAGCRMRQMMSPGCRGGGMRRDTI